jgi:hypothetical protein
MHCHPDQLYRDLRSAEVIPAIVVIPIHVTDFLPEKCWVKKDGFLANLGHNMHITVTLKLFYYKIL